MPWFLQAMELDNQMDPGWNEYRLRCSVGHLITPSLSFPIYEMRVDMRNAFFFWGGGQISGVEVWINLQSVWIG